MTGDLARRHRLAGIGVLALLAPLIAVVPAQAASATVAQSWVFEYTGSPQVFVVPADVTALTIIADGAVGENGDVDLHLDPVAPAGRGGSAMGTFTVTGGSSLTIWVGGGGGDDNWGFGCGGNGRDAEADGGDGGGASGVSLGAFAGGEGCDSSRPSVAQTLVVAGGGGGGGGTFNQNYSIGPGGDGGNPAQPGMIGTEVAGCGGCQSGYNGEDGPFVLGEGGSGGGGGGIHGGGSVLGSIDASENGAGGGGGQSYLDPSANSPQYFTGVGTGNGRVTLIAGEVQEFECIGAEQSVTVPDEADIMLVYAVGGRGGRPSEGGLGGAGGIVSGQWAVTPGDSVTVGVGCYGAETGGFGGAGASGGTHGIGHSSDAHDGGGGGGASAVTINGQPLLYAGGGGGGGGTADFSGLDGGGGGAGGINPQWGWRGQGQIGTKTTPGGCGGCNHALVGQHGFSSSTAAEGGGGGGGGGGYQGGGGGLGGRPISGGGGGGGGGLSWFTGQLAGTVTTGVSERPGDGIIILAWLTNGPLTLTATGGDHQYAEIGEEFGQPLTAKVTALNGIGVPNVPVTFNLGEDGDRGAVFEGGGSTAVVNTDAHGYAVSPKFTASGGRGQWLAIATAPMLQRVEDVAWDLWNGGRHVDIGASLTPPSPLAGQAFTADATVSESGVDPLSTGEVRFGIGPTDFGAGAVTNGAASAAYPLDPGDPSTWLAPGQYTLGAAYVAEDAAPNGVEVPFTVRAIPTTIALTSAPNPSEPTEAVAFTAHLAVPAGSVLPAGATITFSADGTGIGEVPITPDGTAVLSGITDLSPGSHQITAEYAGSTFYSASSGSHTQVVDAEGTAVTVTATPNPSAYSAAVTYTATVTGAIEGLTPTGSVDFSAPTGALCSATLVDGVGSCQSGVALDPGPVVITAAYTPDDDEFSPSSGQTTHTVEQVATAVTVTTDPAGSVVGQPVTLRAVLDWGGFAPVGTAGTVQFLVDGVPVGAPIPVGVEPVTVGAPALAVGSRAIGAVYSGTTLYAGSTGHSIHPVHAATTTVAVSGSPEPSDPGGAVTFTAAVSRVAPATGVPQGTVRFTVDGQPIAPPIPVGPTGSAVAPEISTLGPGEHVVIATFVPTTPSDGGSFGETEHRVRIPTTTVLTSDVNPSDAGAPVHFTATVDPVVNEGTMSFSVGGSPIAECQNRPVTDGVAECVADLELGEYVVGAGYSGSVRYLPSTGSMEQGVEQAAPAVGVESTADPSTVGDAVSFRAMVSAPLLGSPVPTGSVQFFLDDEPWGAPVALVGGAARSASTSALPVGEHLVTALYLGDAEYALAIGETTQQVRAAVIPVTGAGLAPLAVALLLLVAGALVLALRRARRT